MRVFLIRRKGTTDQFSTAGSLPRWDKYGKVWKTTGVISNHLLAHQEFYAEPENEAEIVCYELKTPISTERVDSRLKRLNEARQAGI